MTPLSANTSESDDNYLKYLSIASGSCCETVIGGEICIYKGFYCERIKSFNLTNSIL